MHISKILPNMKTSFAKADQIFRFQGFRKTGRQEALIYRGKLRDAATQSEYYLNIAVRKQVDEQGTMRIGSVYFDRTRRIPLTIMEAAKSKLAEMADYLYDIRERHDRVEENADLNGRMAPNNREIKRLGREMEHMKTNSQITDEGRIPDPIQYNFPHK
jgi:hypothetical protein